MKEFEVRRAPFDFEESNTQKVRPTVLIGLADKNRDVIYFGIYKARKKFANSDLRSSYYKIQDLSAAGLTMDSYIKVSQTSTMSESEYSKCELLGSLSQRDIDGMAILYLYYETTIYEPQQQVRKITIKTRPNLHKGLDKIDLESLQQSAEKLSLNQLKENLTFEPGGNKNAVDPFTGEPYPADDDLDLGFDDENEPGLTL
jgi:hypothetical protein